MNAEAHRKLGIADALVVVAGVAASLGLVRLLLPSSRLTGFLAELDLPWSFSTPGHVLGLTLEASTFLGVPALTAWTPACLLLQLMKPRPRWRRLRRGPGFVACLIACSLVVVTLLGAWICSRYSLWHVWGHDDDFVPPLITGGFLVAPGSRSAGRRWRCAAPADPARRGRTVSAD